MRFVFVIILIAVFGYALALILANNSPLVVTLPLVTTFPTMSAGLLLLITLALGIVVGLLLGVQVFRVFQKSWEIRRLRKEIDQLRQQQIQAASSAAAAVKQDKVPVSTVSP